MGQPRNLHGELRPSCSGQVVHGHSELVQPGELVHSAMGHGGVVRGEVARVGAGHGGVGHGGVVRDGGARGGVGHGSLRLR